MALDQFFKEKRARTEIVRLNIEIKHLITSIRNENQHLHTVERQLLQSDPVLAFHVAEYRRHHTHFDSIHLLRLSQLAKLPGFTGSLEPGEAVKPFNPLPLSSHIAITNPLQGAQDEDGEDESGDSDQDGDSVGAEIIEAFSVATDPLNTSTEVVHEQYSQ